MRAHFRAALGAVARSPAGSEGVRWGPEESWHVTLAFLGRVADVDAAVAVLSSAALLPAGSVPAAAGPATATFGRRVLHVPVAGLDDLARRISAAPWPAGEGADLGREPSPHVTIARAGAPRTGRAGQPRRGGDLRSLSGIPVSARWTVGAVSLVASETRAAGARYREVARRPLC